MRIKVLLLAAAFAIPTIASAEAAKKSETTDRSMDRSKLDSADVKDPDGNTRVVRDALCEGHLEIN